MTNIFELLHHNNKDSKENGTQISYNNTVTIAGRIVHIFAPGNVTIITISASTNRINYPKVLFFGDNCEKAARFKIGDMVRIEGNIQSSKVEPGKNLKSVSVFGDNIEHMDDYQAESFYDVGSNINRIEVTGTVVDFFDWNHILKLKIRTFKNNRMSIVPVDYYHSGTNPLSNIKAGDVISLKGNIQTKKKLLDGKTVHFENYVARNIIVNDVSCRELEVV